MKICKQRHKIESSGYSQGITIKESELWAIAFSHGERNKIAKNDAFDNKEHKEMFPTLEHKEIVLGPYNEFSHVVTGQ